MVWVKICGVTREEDALAVAGAGADAIGLNFAPRSPRRVDVATARRLVLAVGARVSWVGVFVDADPERIEETVREVGLDFVQLHGSESPEAARLLEDRLRRTEQGARVYKALRIGADDDVREAARFAGDRVLVDAKVPGLEGGSGQTFDWSLVEGLARERAVVLAGGLHPDNVRTAIEKLRPFGVDTASGVERAPGIKDEGLVRAFVEAARRA